MLDNASNASVSVCNLNAVVQYILVPHLAHTLKTLRTTENTEAHQPCLAPCATAAPYAPPSCQSR